MKSQIDVSPYCGPIAQRQSRGLIIPWFQVRILVGPIMTSYPARLSMRGLFCEDIVIAQATYLAILQAGVAQQLYGLTKDDARPG